MSIIDYQRPLVSVIVVHYGRPDLTLALLDTLGLIQYPSMEIIVVDNGSNPEISSHIQDGNMEICLIRSDHNRGYASGCNLGIERAKGDYLLLLNNDIEVRPDLVGKMVGMFEDDDMLGGVSPMIRYHPQVAHGMEHLIQYAGSTRIHTFTGRNKTIGWKSVDLGQFPAPYPTAYLHGAAMMIPAKVVQDAGLMPEDYFMYYEEMEWSRKIRAAGYRLMVQPLTHVYHKEDSFGGFQSPMQTYYLTRNRILYMKRNRSRWHFYVFMLYFLFFSIPVNLFRLMTRGRFRQAGAFLAGLNWDIRNRFK